MSENENTPMDQPKPRLIAAVTVVLPARVVGGRKRGGRAVRPGQELPLEGVKEEHIATWLESGAAYWEGRIPLRREVLVTRREQDLNVSSVKKGDDEDNPLDNGIDLVPGESDPQLQSKLDLLAQAQLEQAEEDGEELLDEPEPEDRHVEINAETGDVVEHGGEEFFEDDGEVADSQVS